MKILMISSTDSKSGSGIAAKRLSDGLIQSGVDVTLFVQSKREKESYIVTIPTKRINILYRVLNKILRVLMHTLYRSSNNIYHSLDIISKNDYSWINDSDFDVVHLHWISDVISIREVSRITKPIVWTMHDSWVCCGAEHHPNVIENDRRWMEGYYRSNKPDTTQGLDICRYIWQIKRRFWRDNKIWFVAPSNWEKDVLNKSALFHNNHCSVIANILPFDIFYERDRVEQRRKRNIPDNKKILGFGAAYGLDNPKSIKGTYYLIEALNSIVNKDEYYVIIFGPAKEEFTKLITIQLFTEEYVDDPNELAELYSCCDCFVNSSLIENFSYTIFESLACGTPVVAFDVGGSSDLIEHKTNGYLAKAYDSKDLAEGIEYCLSKEGIRKKCKEICMKYSKTQAVNEHIEVYRQVIENHERNNE